MCYDGNLDPKENFDWESFVEFYSKITKDDHSLLSLYRQRTLFNAMKPFKVSTKVRDLLQENRSKRYIMVHQRKEKVCFENEF